MARSTGRAVTWDGAVGRDEAAGSVPTAATGGAPASTGAVGTTGLAGRAGTLRTRPGASAFGVSSATNASTSRRVRLAARARTAS
jgi:hypothetical protein